jgi:hypothetical protein
VDPLREPSSLVQCTSHLIRHLGEERCRSRIVLDQRRGALDADRERDELLLEAVVELALDLAALGVGCQDEALAGRMQLLDLAT